MAYKHTASYSVASSSGAQTVSGSQNEVGSNEINIDTVFAAGSTNVVMPIAFNFADLQSIILVSDKNMTIKFNSSGTGVPQIDLIAGDPFIWRKSSGYFANKFTANITTSYITCTPAASLKGKILLT